MECLCQFPGSAADRDGLLPDDFFDRIQPAPIVCRPSRTLRTNGADETVAEKAGRLCREIDAVMEEADEVWDHCSSTADGMAKTLELIQKGERVMGQLAGIPMSSAVFAASNAGECLRAVVEADELPALTEAASKLLAEWCAFDLAGSAGADAPAAAASSSAPTAAGQERGQQTGRDSEIAAIEAQLRELRAAASAAATATPAAASAAATSDPTVASSRSPAAALPPVPPSQPQPALSPGRAPERPAAAPTVVAQAVC